MSKAGKPSTSKREVWKEAAGFPNYAVSSHGRVMRTKTTNRAKAGYIIKPAIHYSGYFQHNLHREGKPHNVRLHRLVCETFYGPAPSSEHQVAHWDDDKTNNKANNLRWVTRLQNEVDKDRNGRRRRGSRIPWAKLNEEQVVEIRRRIAALTNSLAMEFNVPIGLLRHVIAGRSWKHLL